MNYKEEWLFLNKAQKAFLVEALIVNTVSVKNIILLCETYPQRHNACCFCDVWFESSDNGIDTILRSKAREQLADIK